MSKHKDYWRNLDPSVKQVRLANMRAYANARYERMKANGQIKLKGRPRSAYGARNKVGFIQDYIDAQKVAIGECFDCGLPCEDWSVIMFAFDHLDPSQKSFALSNAKTQPLDVIDAEIAKCQMVCHCCHAIRTVSERHYLGVQSNDALPLLELMQCS